MLKEVQAIITYLRFTFLLIFCLILSFILSFTLLLIFGIILGLIFSFTFLLIFGLALFLILSIILGLTLLLILSVVFGLTLLLILSSTLFLKKEHVIRLIEVQVYWSSRIKDYRIFILISSKKIRI